MNKIASVFLIFLSGIGINLTPCVYPLIPITISYFGARSERISKPYIHAFVYILGIAITNSLLAFISSITGNILGFALQNPYVIVSISALIFIMALSLFGKWEIRTPLWISRILSKQLSGYKGSFFIGLLFGILAAPCAGPFIIGLMVYVAKEADPFTGFIYFLSLSLGMGIPIGVIATFSGMINRLPAAGEWMVWIKKFLAWILIFMTAYIIRPVIGEIWQRWLMGIIVLLAGIHLGFLDKIREKKFYTAKRIAGIFLILSSTYFFITSHSQKIQWLSYNETLIKQAQKMGKPIIVDFYADWCASCIKMDKKVFCNNEVIKMSKRFVMIRVDLTRQDPSYKFLLKKFDIKGIPAVLFVTKKGIFKLEGEVTEREFIEKMKQAVLSNI